MVFNWLWTAAPRCLNAVQKCIITETELVNPASFVILGSQKCFFGLEPLSALVNSEWWLSSLTKRKSSCIVLARPLVYKNSSLVDGLCLIQFSFCVQITHFVCIFSIFLLCYAPSRPSLRPVFAACSWVSLPGFCHTHWFQINTLGMCTKAGTKKSCK